MRKRRIFRAIAISLILAITVDTIPVYALPVARTNEEPTELQQPEGTPLPTEPPSLEELENDGGIPEDEWLEQPPAPDGTETYESPILEEIQDKREENTKHFLTEDHIYLAAVYPSAVHYEEEGVWKDIDNTLCLQRDSEGNAYYENLASDTHVRFAQSAAEETIVSIEREGLTLSWGFAPAADEPNPENSMEETPAEEAMEEEPTEEEPSAEESSTAETPIAEIQTEEVQTAEAQPEAAQEEAPAASTFHVIQNPRRARIQAATRESLPQTEEEIQAYNEACLQLPHLTSGGCYSDILPGIDLSYVVSANTVKESVTLQTAGAAGTPLTFRLSHP